MKKFIALALALVMLAALAVPAFAATKTASTVISYSVGETYEISIPETLNVNDSQTLTVKTTAVNVDEANVVEVAITAGAFKLGGKAYKLGDITAAGADAVVISAAEDKTENLTFAWVDGAPTQASVEAYTDTITFTAAIVTK